MTKNINSSTPDHSGKPVAAPWPVKRDLRLAYSLSLVIAGLMAVGSAAGFVFGPVWLYGVEPKIAAGMTAAAAGVLVPGFLAQDLLNLIFGLPVILGALWLARRGALIGLLLWPGALFYVLYTYARYVIAAPFNQLFLVYVALVALSAFTLIGLLASIDGEGVRQRLTGSVPARVVGGILVALALLTIAQDASGALFTALASVASVAPLDLGARGVWAVDLTVGVPATLIGGALLWRRAPLGYVAGAGLLFAFGLTPLGFAAIVAFQPQLTAAPVDMATLIGLLIFVVTAFAPLAFFVRRARRPIVTLGKNERGLA